MGAGLKIPRRLPMAQANAQALQLDGKVSLGCKATIPNIDRSQVGETMHIRVFVTLMDSAINSLRFQLANHDDDDGDDRWRMHGWVLCTMDTLIATASRRHHRQLQGSLGC